MRRLEPIGVAACTIYLVALVSCAALGPVGVVLSEAAAAACAAQGAANLVGEVAARTGNTTAAQRAARASQLLGLGCLW